MPTHRCTRRHVATLLGAAGLLIGRPCRAAEPTALHHRLDGDGTATVVFVSGLGEPLQTWDPVAADIARLARTLRYDRSGIGASPPASSPRSIDGMADELHDLLRALGLARVVVVGHSLGGAIAQAFARRHPQAVAGLVLVDPEDGRLLAALEAVLSPELWAQRERALAAAMPGMPPGVRAEMQALRDSTTLGDAIDALPAVPTVVLTGTLINPRFPGNPEEQQAKLRMHERLVARNPGAVHTRVPESRHYIQRDAPAVVVEAVRSVLRRVGN